MPRIPKIRAGWRVRMMHGQGTQDDYDVYRGYVLAKYVRGDITEEERDRELAVGANLWSKSPHFDGDLSLHGCKPLADG